MADRILRWHVPGVLSEKGVVDSDVQGQAHRLDRDYRVLDTWVRVKTAPQGTGGTGIVIDINDDGTSIYLSGHEANLPDNTLEATVNTFSSPDLVLVEGSIITLDVDQVGGEFPGEDLVVDLYLAAD